MNENNYSFGFNQFYPNQGNYGSEYGNGNGGVLNKIGNGLQGIYNYKWLLIFIMLSIPILTFMIIAFTKKGVQSELGWTCLLLLLTISIFYYAYVIRNVPPNQFILLLVLIIFEIGFIIYFLTKFNVNLNQKDEFNEKHKHNVEKYAKEIIQDQIWSLIDYYYDPANLNQCPHQIKSFNDYLDHYLSAIISQYNPTQIYLEPLHDFFKTEIQLRFENVTINCPIKSTCKCIHKCIEILTHD